jgi:hypothetical protein
LFRATKSEEIKRGFIPLLQDVQKPHFLVRCQVGGAIASEAWTGEIADVRVHGTTGEAPIVRF